MWSDTKNDFAKTFSFNTGASDDMHDAAEDMTDEGNVDAANEAAKNVPATKDKVLDGNIVWRSLWNASFGSSNDLLYKELLMSMTGTVVFKSDEEPKPYGPTDINFETVMNGDATEQVQVMMYTCDTIADEFSCKNLGGPTLRNLGRSFKAITRDRVNQIVTNMAAGTIMTAADIQFIGSASLPVYKVLAVAAASGDANNFMVDYASDVLAIDYTHLYLKEAIKNIQEAMTVRKGKVSETEAKAFDSIQARIEALQNNLNDARIALNTKISASLQAAARIKQYDRTMMIKAREQLNPTTQAR